MAQANFTAGSTQSSAIDLTPYFDTGMYRAGGLILPANFLACTLTFQASFDGGNTYLPIIGTNGSPYSVAANPSTYQALDAGIFGTLTNIKLISSVTQTNAVNISVQLARPTQAGSPASLTGSGTGTGGAGGGGVVTSSFYHGQGTVGTVASQLVTASQALVNGANVENPGTATLFVGNSVSVTTATGYPVSAGASIGIAVNNLNAIYIVGQSVGQSVAWIGD